MALSQAEITEVQIALDGPELYIRWDSRAPWGATYQVYVDRKLSWYGLTRACRVPVPARAAARNLWVEVAAVDASEATRDYSSSLSSPPGNTSRACLTWEGGSYLEAGGNGSFQGYRIYMSSVPNGDTDCSEPVATVAAYNSRVITDGFGLAGYGAGGFGRAPSSYQWKSDPLASGEWRFAVRPYDGAGNEQATQAETSVTIAAAPRAPAINAQGARLGYSYSGPSQRIVTLSWQPSPT